jgi:hypothetical protein
MKKLITLFFISFISICVYSQDTIVLKYTKAQLVKDAGLTDMYHPDELVEEIKVKKSSPDMQTLQIAEGEIAKRFVKMYVSEWIKDTDYAICEWDLDVYLEDLARKVATQREVSSGDVQAIYIMDLQHARVARHLKRNGDVYTDNYVVAEIKVYKCPNE